MEKNFRNAMLPTKTGDFNWIYSDETISNTSSGWVWGNRVSNTSRTKRLVIFNSIDLPFATKVSSIALMGYSFSVATDVAAGAEVGLFASSESGAPSRKIVSTFATSRVREMTYWDFPTISLAPGRYHFAFYYFAGAIGRTYKAGIGANYWGRHHATELNETLSLGAWSTTSAYWYDAEEASLGTSDETLNLPATLNPAHLKLEPVGAIGKEPGVIDDDILWAPPFFALRLEP